MRLWIVILVTCVAISRAESAVLYLENAEDGGSSMDLAPGESKNINIVLEIESIDTGFAFVFLVFDDDDNDSNGEVDVTVLVPGFPEGGVKEVTYDRSAFDLPADISWDVSGAEYRLNMGRIDSGAWGPGTYVLDTLTLTHNGQTTNASVPVIFEVEFLDGPTPRPPSIVTEDSLMMPWGLGLHGIIPDHADPGVGAEDNPFIINLVSCQGDGGIHNLTRGVDYVSIQCALDAAEDGDEIEVDPGTYFENIDFLGKDITLRSINPLDLDAVELTIIDGGGVNTVVTLSAGEISGFTITNGGMTGTHAAGVHASGSAMVSHNVITNNVADKDGGGVTAWGNAVVRNNRITFNTSGDVGGGVAAVGNSLIIDNYIAFNHAATGGGGVGALYNSTVRNNTIVFNSTAGGGGNEDGGGGILAGFFPVLQNNIVAFSSDGIGIHVAVGSAVTADFNCVFGNLEGNYSGDAVPGPNDLNVDPQLDNDGLHLQSSSPCVDAGDPDLDRLADETDIDHEDRIQNERVDIGADETPLTACEGDANGDGTVDPLDSGFVLARFGCPVGTGDPSCDAADVNGDGAVDPLDSGFVLARFGECP
ncbi:MAG: hypothetical protein IID37_00710 [Planctomycetes bacterium]|nr:hypothetical protein [Planctomycetota bacterium]